MNPDCPNESYDLLTIGGSGLPNGLLADPRFSHLANGPFDLLGYLSKSDYTADPIHRFYQMWQQIDCDAAAAASKNPSGCRNDLFAWVEQTAGDGEGAQAMGVYTSRGGLSPYFDMLARRYAISDNFHQAILGGSGPNHLALAYGRPIFFENSNGTPGTPPSKFILNPNPRSGSANAFINDGVYTNCEDVSQPGVGAIRQYLASLSYRPSSGCYPGEYYLLNNFGPPFFGNGTRAAIGADITRIPSSTQPHIGLLLNNHGVSWKFYGAGWAGGSEDGRLFCDICNPFLYSTQTMTNGAERSAHLKDLTDLYADIQAGTLPAVSFVKPSGFVDGHPSQSRWDLFEEFSRKIIEMAQANPAVWANTAIIVTVDEGGGYWDSGYIQPLDFFGDGPRIPFMVVSNASLGVGIVHTYYDHVSIDKFIERNWRLGETISPRTRDNLPNPIGDALNPYVPKNSPAIGDLFEMFGR